MAYKIDIPVLVLSIPITTTQDKSINFRKNSRANEASTRTCEHSSATFQKKKDFTRVRIFIDWSFAWLVELN